MAIEILGSDSTVFDMARGNTGTVSDICAAEQSQQVRGLSSGGGIAIKIDDKTALHISDSSGQPVKGVINLV